MKSLSFHNYPTMICKTCQSEIPIPEIIVPSPGDVNLCYKCGRLYVFSRSMELVEMTEEMESVFNLKWPKQAAIIRQVRAQIASNSRKN